VPGTPASGSALIQPDAGGVLQGNLGTLLTLLTMPPGAVDAPVQMNVRVLESPPAVGGLQVVGKIFSITAVREETGEPVTQFSRPFTLVIVYRDEEVSGIDESKLTLHYWSEESQAWKDIPSLVDLEGNTLTAVLDHLTVFAMIEGVAPQTLQLYLPLVTKLK
jgi:hypothetical protein